MKTCCSCPALSALVATDSPLRHCSAPPLRPANLTELHCLRPSPLQPSILCVHSGSRGQSSDNTSQGITPASPPPPLTGAFYKDTLIFSLSSPLLPPSPPPFRHPLLKHFLGLWEEEQTRVFKANTCLQLFLRGEEGVSFRAGGHEKVCYMDQTEHWVVCPDSFFFQALRLECRCCGQETERKKEKEETLLFFSPVFILSSFWL